MVRYLFDMHRSKSNYSVLLWEENTNDCNKQLKRIQPTLTDKSLNTNETWQVTCPQNLIDLDLKLHPSHVYSTRLKSNWRKNKSNKCIKFTRKITDLHKPILNTPLYNFSFSFSFLNFKSSFLLYLMLFTKKKVGKNGEEKAPEC